ncbi:22534_t:CDS:2, partial [Dentiscutata erythropus]
ALEKNQKIFEGLMNELMTPCEDNGICLSVSSSNEERQASRASKHARQANQAEILRWYYYTE